MAVVVPRLWQYKIFLPFLNEFGNSKLFELYLILYCNHRGTTMAKEEV